MIDCPEFDYNYEKSHAIYRGCLHAASVVSLIVNPFIIYCIVFRSTNHMSTYRWFLLLHQIASFAADIVETVFSQPVFLIPLPIVYMLGYAKYFLSTKHIWNCGFIFIVFEQITVVLLFSYRYWAVQSSKKFSLGWKCFAAFLIMLMGLNIYLPLSIEIKTEETFNKLAENYTCVTPQLRQIDSIVALDKTEAVLKCMWLIMFDAIAFVVCVAYFTVGSWRATRSNSMSPKLRQMQQRFLVQLCLQSFVPFLVVIGPVVMMVCVFLFDSFNFPWLNDIVWCSVSIFSIISAVILFIMNPNYHQWLTRRFIKKQTKLPMLS